MSTTPRRDALRSVFCFNLMPRKEGARGWLLEELLLDYKVKARKWKLERDRGRRGRVLREMFLANFVLQHSLKYPATIHTTQGETNVR